MFNLQRSESVSLNRFDLRIFKVLTLIFLLASVLSLVTIIVDNFFLTSLINCGGTLFFLLGIILISKNSNEIKYSREVVFFLIISSLFEITCFYLISIFHFPISPYGSFDADESLREFEINGMGRIFSLIISIILILRASY